MDESNKKRARLLGMPFGTANGRLRKLLLFQLVKETNRDICYRCNRKIESIEEFSIEHKQAWMGHSNPLVAFFDLSNIAYSHIICNNKAGIKVRPERRGKPSPRRNPVKEGYGWCSRELAFVPASKFTKDMRNPTGLRYWCNPCRSVYRKERYRQGKAR